MIKAGTLDKTNYMLEIIVLLLLTTDNKIHIKTIVNNNND